MRAGRRRWSCRHSRARCADCGGYCPQHCLPTEHLACPTVPPACSYITADVAEKQGLHVKKLSGTKFRQMLRNGGQLGSLPRPAACLLSTLCMRAYCSHPCLRIAGLQASPSPSGLPSPAWWRCCGSTSSTRPPSDPAHEPTAVRLGRPPFLPSDRSMLTYCQSFDEEAAVAISYDPSSLLSVNALAIQSLLASVSGLTDNRLQPLMDG